MTGRISPCWSAPAACTSAKTIWASKRRARSGSAAQHCWVGVSTHTLEQVDAADRTSADYVAFGPIFPTATKEQPDPGRRSAALLAEARTRTSKPLVAIGGITLERAADTYRAGADSLAVVRDLIAAAESRRARPRISE